ncbi:hypothetical protein M514_09061 [Trichuris suis]|uniref:Uncharacterized protein n=1 Tax=Trichuris suis TaxID=68888 RepID=A0A085LYQ5_9BILA|nr:hypothetical protein M513_09061 [Trichuris suis]KFD59778.1 hypothetical protein M514_09061 [Trichuris suis]
MRLIAEKQETKFELRLPSLPISAALRNHGKLRRMEDSMITRKHNYIKLKTHLHLKLDYWNLDYLDFGFSEATRKHKI